MRVLAISLIAVAGCGAGDDLSDLRDFMAEVRIRQEAPADPLPPLWTPEAAAYRADARRSPFHPSSGPGPAHRGQPGSSSARGSERGRHLLTGQPVERIAMVGTLARGPVRFGLVRVDRGAVERVGAGDRLGENRGRVHRIDPMAIHLLEFVRDENGGWAERPITIALDGPAPGFADGPQP